MYGMLWDLHKNASKHRRVPHIWKWNDKKQKLTTHLQFELLFFQKKNVYGMLWYMYMYWYSDAADDKQNTDAQADLSFHQCHNFFDFIKIKIA